MLKAGLLNKPLKYLTAKDMVKLTNESVNFVRPKYPIKVTVKDIRHLGSDIFQANGKLTENGIAEFKNHIHEFASESGIKNIKDFSKMKIRDYWEVLTQYVKNMKKAV